MKKITELIPIPRENIQNLGISLIAIILFIFAVILPGYMNKLHLDREIITARSRLEEHKNLLPLYQSLIKAPMGHSAVLVVPAGLRLEKAGLDSALMTVRSISDKNKMTVMALIPDLSYGSKNEQSLAVNLTLRGSFENFRTVLTKLGALPYMDHIEELSIQQKPNTQTLAFKVKIILAMN